MSEQHCGIGRSLVQHNVFTGLRAQRKVCQLFVLKPYLQQTHHNDQKVMPESKKPLAYKAHCVSVVYASKLVG